MSIEATKQLSFLTLLMIVIMVPLKAEQTFGTKLTNADAQIDSTILSGNISEAVNMINDFGSDPMADTYRELVSQMEMLESWDEVKLAGFGQVRMLHEEQFTELYAGPRSHAFFQEFKSHYAENQYLQAARSYYLAKSYKDRHLDSQIFYCRTLIDSAALQYQQNEYANALSTMKEAQLLWLMYPTATKDRHANELQLSRYAKAVQKNELNTMMAEEYEFSRALEIAVYASALKGAFNVIDSKSIPEKHSIDLTTTAFTMYEDLQLTGGLSFGIAARYDLSDKMGIDLSVEGGQGQVSGLEPATGLQGNWDTKHFGLATGLNRSFMRMGRVSPFVSLGLGYIRSKTEKRITRTYPGSPGYYRYIPELTGDDKYLYFSLGTAFFPDQSFPLSVRAFITVTQSLMSYDFYAPNMVSFTISSGYRLNR